MLLVTPHGLVLNSWIRSELESYAARRALVSGYSTQPLLLMLLPASANANDPPATVKATAGGTFFDTLVFMFRVCVCVCVCVVSQPSRTLISLKELAGKRIFPLGPSPNDRSISSVGAPPTLFACVLVSCRWGAMNGASVDIVWQGGWRQILTFVSAWFLQSSYQYPSSPLALESIVLFI